MSAATPAAMNARPAVVALQAQDFHRVWPLVRSVLAGGDTYAWRPDTTEAEARALLTTPPVRLFAAEDADGSVLGCYFLKPNQPGLGDHVANAGYMVAPDARGRGIASLLCAHSLDTARAAGFRAMQFNFVVATNTVAIRLWEKHGFAVVGRIPDAFRHARLGPTDVLVMHRRL
ncbi:GNAT family N-acetyltransferase [Coralloluteibacterium thermophilus]|uniref:GNAT family N-acetyltransferase n=1 Tax=Coralloluteibacterium thermophilum TaxID=2707049 RepID=A0ABV9NQL6_9GAMM